MKIEMRQWQAALHETNAGRDDRRKKAHQLARRLDHHVGAERAHQRRVAHELDRIAETLLGMQQDGLADDRFAAPPGLTERTWLHRRQLPARLVPVPSLAERAERQQRLAEIARRLRVVRPQLQRLAQAGDRLLVTTAAQMTMPRLPKPSG